MKTLFNLTTSIDDMQRFSSREDLIKLMDGFDGVELMHYDEDEKGIIPYEKVIGYHMYFFPYWVDFWNRNEEALMKEFGAPEVWEHAYGGKHREVLLERFQKDLDLAHRYGAEYVVFHISDAAIAESFIGNYQHTDEEVIDAAIELINELLKKEDGQLTFLVENLWQPGLNFKRPEMTRRLLEGIQYKNKGIMFDTGHVLHTNEDIATQEEGLEYIYQILDRHGDLCKYIRGIHLNQSLTGEYCKQTRLNPPDMSGTYQERYGHMFLHAFAVDKHLPFTCEGIDKLVERIAPEYLTFEFITANRVQHLEYLTAQRRALKMMK